MKAKKILFIGPIFHDYHTLISAKLLELGFSVTFFQERDYGLSFKIVNNYFNSRLPVLQKKHYRGILKRIRGETFDYLFVIRGYMMPKEFVNEFKRLNPEGILIMYQWDSDKTNPFSHLLKHFSKTFSFDFEDCERHPNLTYLPLFYTDDVSLLNVSKVNTKFDFFFMGWYFPERYQAVLDFRNYMENKNYKLKAYLYLPITTYVRERLRGIKHDFSVVSFKPMKRCVYLKHLEQSRVMVDVSNPNQTGLAMRVIEALASNTKVLTNNYRIKEDEEIYDESYIFLYDGIKPPEKLEIYDMVESKNKLRSIEEWIKAIFASQED